MPKSKKSQENFSSSEPDPNIVFTNGEFTLPNGDRYNGDFCAHRFGLIWREGHGTYITHDGQTYEGQWKDDKIVDGTDLIIKYPTGETFQGRTLRDKYTGFGTYTMDNGMFISCEFFENQPKGPVILVDINGRLWEGQAGPNKVLLLPENEFYANMNKHNGMGEIKHKEEVLAIPDHHKMSEPLQPTESEIFKKSTKTVNDIDLTDSKWYQRYFRYRTMKDNITGKLMTEDPMSLTTEEKKWYKKYREHKRKKRLAADNLLEQPEFDYRSLLNKYYSKQYRQSCLPLKVVYPTVDWTSPSELKFLKKKDSEQMAAEDNG